jgi:hypothetical protein
MTDNRAALTASYSDFKLIKTRMCIQLIFEIPLEQANQALEVLGGMPNPASECWVAIARLEQEGGGANTKGQTRDVTTPPPVASEPQGAPRKSAAQVAGYLCTLPQFQAFLIESYDDLWRGGDSEETPDKHVAAGVVCQLCGVRSRSELTHTNNDWRRLLSDYKAWQIQPSVVG